MPEGRICISLKCLIPPRPKDPGLFLRFGLQEHLFPRSFARELCRRPAPGAESRCATARPALPAGAPGRAPPSPAGLHGRGSPPGLRRGQTASGSRIFFPFWRFPFCSPQRRSSSHPCEVLRKETDRAGRWGARLCRSKTSPGFCACREHPASLCLALVCILSPGTDAAAPGAGAKGDHGKGKANVVASISVKADLLDEAF